MTMPLRSACRGLTAVSPVKPECASCHTGAESLSGNGNGADIARCRMDETPLIRRAAAQLQEYFAGKRKVFDLPLAPEGTPFQHRIWAVLRSIPYGQTLTYGEVAARAGNPKASRAVGMANNRNPDDYRAVPPGDWRWRKIGRVCLRTG